MPKDEEDLLGMLQYFEDCASGTAPEFILQRFVEGVAISTEGWFNGHEFMSPFNHTLERKQLMDHNLGPSGGCSGNVVWAVQGSNHIIDQGLRKMEPVLRQFNYLGPIDLNTIVNAEGVWALEFTPRFGYDAIAAFLELYQGDLGELFYNIASGQKPKNMILQPGFGSALRVSTPPYPSEEFRPKPGIPVNGFTREDRPHLFFYEVMLNKRDQLVTSGSGGTVCAITGYGESIPGSLWGPEELAKRAHIPDKQFRTDLIGELDMDYSKFKAIVQR
jgi:phosphoribosylamine--glycine ligase